MTLLPGYLPLSCREDLARAMLIQDRDRRLAAIDKARERAVYLYPHLFKTEVSYMQVKLRNVRLAFPNLFQPKAFQGEGKADFNAAFLLPKDHPQLKEIRDAMIAVAKEKWGAKAKKVYEELEAKDRLALHDGDVKELDGYADHFFINARNATRPTVVDRARNQVTEADGIVYAGCYVNAIVEFWAQDNQFGKRINASLGGVQFFADGDAFAGGRAASSDEFDDLGDGAGEESKATAGGEAW